MKYKDIYGDTPEQVAKEIGKIAVARARYRVQEDFNRELVDEIAAKTGHENLAATCFADISLESNEDLDVRFYNDWRVIDGLYSSNSSFHKSGDKWESIAAHYDMSRGEFWERKDEGYGGESHGIVDPDWLADNFWEGIYWVTNGWPRGQAEFLHSWPTYDVSAISIMRSYCARYRKSRKFQHYIQDEINKMK